MVILLCFYLSKILNAGLVAEYFYTVALQLEAKDQDKVRVLLPPWSLSHSDLKCNCCTNREARNWTHVTTQVDDTKT